VKESLLSEDSFKQIEMSGSNYISFSRSESPVHTFTAVQHGQSQQNCAVAGCTRFEISMHIESGIWRSHMGA
jgi:hypothetical protein